MTRNTKSERQPRTAYDLCERVAQHIEEEPLRYIQTAWWLRGIDLDWIINRQHRLPAAPSCGTAACRAGWIVTMHDGIGGAKLVDREGNIGRRAVQILGVTPGAIIKLFDARAVTGQPGTPEYARAGAAGLRRWAKRHAATLKARLLSDVPKLEGPS